MKNWQIFWNDSFWWDLMISDFINLYINLILGGESQVSVARLTFASTIMLMRLVAHLARMKRACARTSINIYWCKTSRLNNNKWSLYFTPSGSPSPVLFLYFLLSALACARASMYVFIDVTRDSRTQLTTRKHRMHRGYTSVFRVCFWHSLSGVECRSRFLYDINPRSAMHLIHEDRACGITWPRILRMNSAGNDDKAT